MTHSDTPLDYEALWKRAEETAAQQSALLYPDPVNQQRVAKELTVQEFYKLAYQTGHAAAMKAM